MTLPTDTPRFPKQVLQNWIEHGSLSAADRQALRANLQADAAGNLAFGIDPAALDSHLQVRLDLLRTVHDDFQRFCRETWNSHPAPLELLWRLWLPLALQLSAWRQTLDRPLIQGMLGGQGTGKTTLTQILQIILRKLGLNSVCLSIDDLYKTYAERQALQQQDPRLIWRGPPGTHDLELALQILNQLRDPLPGEEIEIPRFDKSAWNGAGDRTSPDHVQDIDIVLFEGWFVGVRPVDPQLLEQAPDPIRTEGDRAFAQANNQRLQAYLPLWDRLDRLIVLLPEDYRFSKTWRREAEHQMKASGKPGMSDREIEQFVDYFWTALHPTLFIEPLAQNPQYTDLVIEIDAQHQPHRVYRPQQAIGIGLNL